MAVSVSQRDIEYVSTNPEGIGFFKRPELNAKASGGLSRHANPVIQHHMRYRIARIYMPQRKHVHCHPTNKTIGNYWVIDFGTWGHYKSPLMGWGRATRDMYANVQIKFPRLSDAIGHAEVMGWGYDIQYPTHRWHTKKNYADNFKYKGEPKAPESYD